MRYVTDSQHRVSADDAQERRERLGDICAVIRTFLVVALY